jgi:hypothetical protein
LIQTLAFCLPSQSLTFKQIVDCFFCRNTSKYPVEKLLSTE